MARLTPATRQLVAMLLAVFSLVAIGCTVAFAFWLQDFTTPQVAVLGSGDRLSLFVADGPSRLILATGNDPVEYENALASFRPLFAHRVDVLLLAGPQDSLLVPLRAYEGGHARTVFLMTPPPTTPGNETLAETSPLTAPRRIRLGPNLTVMIETALPVGASPDDSAPYWRATIERGNTRIVVLSEGDAAALFPPSLPASLLVVSGSDPTAAWEHAPAVAFAANADAITGPDMRSAFADSRHPPTWGFRIAPGEALRIHFTATGIELPSASAQVLNGTPPSGLREEASHQEKSQ